MRADAGGTCGAGDTVNAGHLHHTLAKAGAGTVAQGMTLDALERLLSDES